METTNSNTPNREDLYTKLAISTIRLNAIETKVRTVRSGLERTTGAVVRRMSFSRMALRVAAVLVIVLGSASVYKYASVNSDSLFNKQFRSYELGATRGETKPDLQAFSYQNANWLDVVAANNMAPVQTNKSRFLAGMAQMELKQYGAALELFNGVLANTKDDSYRDDAEYYAALGYLANHESKQALELINQIKTNPDHKYYYLVRNMSSLDLKIVAIKK